MDAIAIKAELDAWPHVSELWGISLAERDRRFAAHWQPLRAAIDEALASGATQSFDASAAGFVWGGDLYHARQGVLTRELTPIDVALPAPVSLSGAPVDDASVLARLHAVADLSPSATNWQPHRVCVLSEDAAVACGVAIADADPRALGFLFFRRPRYESLLGDILDLFGENATAFEEWVDPGIYVETLRLLAQSSGLTIGTVDASRARPPPATALVPGAPIDARHLPFVFIRFRGEPHTSEALARLVLSRSSHRVASPVRTLPLAPLADFTGEQVVWLGADDPAVSAIGHAMFTALYGEGADLQTKQGGVGGIDLQAEKAAAHLGVALDAPVRAVHLGPYLGERFTDRYEVRNGMLMGARGEPMTYRVLTRMARTFASAMGAHFLQFHNTHPAVGIVLAAPGGEGAYAAGTLAARTLYFARAQGWAAIVKSGPIDLAESRIARAIENAVSPRQRTALRAGELRPALTLQVGGPLANEMLSSGRTGLELRARDLRPPRAHPLAHFFV
jgi:hypothetical protein